MKQINLKDTNAVDAFFENNPVEEEKNPKSFYLPDQSSFDNTIHEIDMALSHHGLEIEIIINEDCDRTEGFRFVKKNESLDGYSNE